MIIRYSNRHPTGVRIGLIKLDAGSLPSFSRSCSTLRPPASASSHRKFSPAALPKEACPTGRTNPPELPASIAPQASPACRNTQWIAAHTLLRCVTLQFIPCECPLRAIPWVLRASVLGGSVVKGDVRSPCNVKGRAATKRNRERRGRKLRGRVYIISRATQDFPGWGVTSHCRAMLTL